MCVCVILRFFYFVVRYFYFIVALRLKGRSFSKEIMGLFKDALLDEGLSKEAFYDKRDFIERCWEEIMASMNDCVGLVDDVEEKGR